jgi:hypothetical protein
MEETSQIYTVFKKLNNDQQLYIITVQMTWWYLHEFQNFVPCLGEMHMLMSFVDCVGTRMPITGLLELMQAAFTDVPSMLLDKKFPTM